MMRFMRSPGRERGAARQRSGDAALPCEAEAQCTPRPARGKRAALRRFTEAVARGALLATLAVMTPASAQESFDMRGPGRPFAVTVLRPTAPPLGAVVLAHGFLRDAGSLATLATQLAAAGALVLVPELPHHADAPANAAALRELVVQLRGGALGAVPAKTVLVGFSAGGLATLLTAARTPGISAWIGLDPVDREGEGLHAAARVSAPATMLRARPDRCNAFANSFSWGSFLPRLQRDTLVDGATHCDFQDDDPVCAAACGAADAARQAAIRAEVVALVAQALR
jgi:pimeloyl-ACP methyl ester carboxylesterase